MIITPFALGSYIIDTALLLSLGHRTGPLARTWIRRCAGMMMLLLLFVLYSSVLIFPLNGALIRFASRLLVTSVFFLLTYRLKPASALYMAALLTEITNLIHGFFLTPLTSGIQRGFGTLGLKGLGALAAMLLLRIGICWIVYLTIKPERLGQITPLRVLLLSGVTAISQVTRSIQFHLLNTNADAADFGMSIYFFSLQLALLLALILYENYQVRAQESRALQNQQQATRSLLHTLEILKENDETIRRMRHDMKNHMLAIQTMIGNGENEQASAYIDEFLHRSAPTQLRIQTGRAMLDALINEKLGAAAQQGIAVSVVMDFRAGSFIPDFELCMLMGNALDNAVEACLLVPPEQHRFIEIKGGVVANQLTVRVVNSCIPHAAEHAQWLRTTKKDSQEHGYGISIIRSTLHQFDGILQIQTDVPDRFCLLMSIPIRENVTDSAVMSE